MLREVIGQSGSIRLFARLVARSRLPHAVILEGVPGCGRRTLARALAMALLCPQRQEGDACGTCEHCRQMRSGTHPDLIELPGDQDPVPAEWGGGVEAQRRIPVEWVRERICEHAYASPLLGVGRVFLIPAAERLRGDAANALLKVLEEPPPGAWILLTAANVASLLPTIRSRAQVFRLLPLNIGDVERVLLRRGIDVRRAAALAARSTGGHRGLADSAVEPPMDALLRLCQGLDLAACSQVISALPQKAGEAEERSLAAEQRHTLRQWLAALEGRLRQDLRSPDPQRAGMAADRIQRVGRARGDLDRNIAPRLVLEGFALAR